MAWPGGNAAAHPRPVVPRATQNTSEQQLKDRERLIELIEDWTQNPVHFVCEALGAQPDPWQCDVMDAVMVEDNVALRACHGPGKAQPNDLVIDTPTGPRKFGDLQIGDMVFGGDGRPTPVVGVFERGMQVVYRVVFNDGSSTLCCREHLWMVKRRKNIAHRPWSVRQHVVLSLEEILQKGIKHRNGKYLARNFEIPVTPLAYPSRWVPVDPYTLGVWLGDGTKQSSIICTNDDDVYERVVAAGYVVRRYWYPNGKTRKSVGYVKVYGLNTGLRQLGVFDCGAREKFIPVVYLYNSVEVREELLRGLMDSDGTYGKRDGSAYYGTMSEQLAGQVAWLVRSLGGVARVKQRKSGFWVLTLTLPPGQWGYVRRKVVRQRATTQKRYLGRWIDHVETIGPALCRCIKVQNDDGLYVANDGIVTHNTTLLSWETIHFTVTRPYCKVPSTAPTFNKQVKDVLWAEIHKWWRIASQRSLLAQWLDANFELLTTRLQYREAPTEWFAVGIASSKAINMEGYHAPHVLVIFDEAKGIAKPAWDAVQGMRTTQEAKFLVASTPGGLMGEFHKVFTKYRQTWKSLFVIHPEALRSKLKYPEAPPYSKRGEFHYYSTRIRDEWVEERKLEWGEGTPVFEARVAGEFPSVEGDYLIPYKWLALAEGLEAGAPGRRVVACDVARYGRDRTVGLVGEGGTLLGGEAIARTAEATTAQEIKTFGIGADPKRPLYRSIVATAEFCVRLRETYNAELIVIDDTGLGGGAADLLRHWGERVMPVNFGAPPTDKPMDAEARASKQRRHLIDTNFVNIKAQMGWALRGGFESQTVALSALPASILEALIAQCSLVKYELDAMGRIRIVDPDEQEDAEFAGLTEEGKKSPDHFHALLLYWWAAGSAYRTLAPKAGTPHFRHLRMGHPTRGVPGPLDPRGTPVGGQGRWVSSRYRD